MGRIKPRGSNPQPWTMSCVLCITELTQHFQSSITVVPFFRASERNFDSPTPSSLHHSYETLNMYEETGFAGNAPPKTPHRPAPPVPPAKTKTSNFGANTMAASGDEIEKYDTYAGKKKTK